AYELNDWSSREDKRLFARTSREAGVVIMGRTTFETLSAPLPGRLHMVLTRNARLHVPGTSAAGPIEYTGETPTTIVAGLEARGYTTAVLAGGAQTYRAFLEAGAVDELWLTIEPLLFGAGISLLGDAACDLRLTLLESRTLGTDAVHLRY